MDTLLQDIRFTLRTLRKNPGFTAVVVLTLAVAIGATTALFSVINAVLLGSLPFDEPDRLVMGRATFDGNINPYVSGYDYYDYREQSRSFESLASLAPWAGRFTILGDAEPDRVAGTYVSWDLFRTLRVSPVLGRSFAADEGIVAGPPVTMLSYGYWQRRFGGSPDALNSTLTVDGSPYTVVGVMPAGFYLMHDVDVWLLTFRDGPLANARRWHNLLLLGRLTPDVTIQQAQSEIDGISGRLEQQYPDTNEGKALRVTGLHDVLVENVRMSLLMLMVAVVLVLLMACGNVAGLLLARGQGRLAEIAIRSAMGAPRRVLVRQLLTESTLMAMLGGALGVAFALLFQSLLVRLLPMGQLGITRLGIEASVLLFALGVSAVTGLIFGVLPAMRGTVVDPSQQLKTGGRASEARGSSRLRSGLVVLQVSMSIVLLIGAGLLIRSLAHQMSVDLGFDQANVLTAGLPVPESDYPEPEQRVSFFSSLVEDVRALPGVTSVGLINRLPIRDPGGNIYVHPVGEPPGPSQMSRSADFRIVLPGYFETMRIPLLAGRDIADTDVAESPRVMVISQSLGRLLFPDQNPIGERVVVDMGEPVVHDVVGVTADARLSRVKSQPFHAMYMSYRQNPNDWMRIAIRTAGDPTSLVRPVRELLRQKNRNIPLAEPATMASVIDDAISDFRVITASLGVFSSIALMLALVGLYGVLAYYVHQRYHEIGVRMALGATGSTLIGLVLGRGFALVSVGLVLGVGGALVATRLLQQFLFETQATDPATFVGVTLLFGLVTLLACLLPAWRATRVNPVVALRYE